MPVQCSPDTHLDFLCSSGREEKGSQGSGGGGHGPAPSSSSSRTASRARRRGHGHGKRPSAWDVIPSLANDGQVVTLRHTRPRLTRLTFSLSLPALSLYLSPSLSLPPRSLSVYLYLWYAEIHVQLLRAGVRGVRARRGDAPPRALSAHRDVQLHHQAGAGAALRPPTA
jgi:hypothetical protein